MPSPIKQIVYLILLATLLLAQSAAYSKEYKANQNNNLCKNPKYINAIHGLWQHRKPTYYKWVKASEETPYNLYNIQGETNNLLKYAWGCKDQYILNELITLYLQSLKTLDTTNKYSFYYYPENKRQSIHPLHQNHRIWLDNKGPVGNESILASSQFLALISELINDIIEVPAQNRTPKMSQLIQEFIPILSDHYNRWIFSKPGPFQVRGWGCKYNNHYVKTGMNHLEYITKKKNYQLGNNKNHTYCNAVFDTDLWIITGVSNLLAINKKAPSSASLPEKTQNKFKSYLEIGLKLLSQRMTKTKLINNKGGEIEGINFDAGIWSDYDDYLHAGLNDPNIKDIKQLINSKKHKKVINIGWDISHARRFVHVFEALNKNKEILGLSFPSKKITTGLANQLLYKVFNRDFKYPLFSNFMDGSNGWFRVNYSGRKGYGYGPWDMSNSVLTGGFALWQPYNTDIEELYSSLSKMINSKNKNARSHVSKHYEKYIWYSFKRNANYDLKDRYYPGTQTMLIQLLPSMYHFPHDTHLPLIN